DRIIFTIELRAYHQPFKIIEEGKTIRLVGLHMKHLNGGYGRADPRVGKARSAGRSFVYRRKVGRRPVLTETGEVVLEGIAVAGEAPDGDEEHAAILLADHLPGVRSLDGERESRAGNAGLVRPVSHDGLGAAAIVTKRIFISAEIGHLHYIDDFAFRRIEL